MDMASAVPCCARRSTARASRRLRHAHAPSAGLYKDAQGRRFRCASRTPVFAAGDGVVEKMGWWGGYGKYVRLRHNADTGTAYAHLSRFNPNFAAKAVRVSARARSSRFTGSTGAVDRPASALRGAKARNVQINPLTVTDATLGDTCFQGREMVGFRKGLMERSAISRIAGNLSSHRQRLLSRNTATIASTKVE